MSDDETLKILHEAIERTKKMTYSEILEGLRRRGIVNEKGEVIVRMPIGPGPNRPRKRKRKRKKPDESSSPE